MAVAAAKKKQQLKTVFMKPGLNTMYFLSQGHMDITLSSYNKN